MEKDPNILDEEKDVEEQEETVAEEQEEAAENPESDVEQDEAVSEEAVLEHAQGDEGKWDSVFSRLDALEQRVGELMMQGGPVKAEMEEESEISDVELENQKWYERNAQTRNGY